MAVASGMPVPEVYVLDHELGINSFAAGHTQSDVAIGGTRGCLKLLNRDELQGVVAHEFSHILNGDTRLNMRLIGIAHGILLPVIVGRVLLSALAHIGQEEEFAASVAFQRGAGYLDAAEGAVSLLSGEARSLTRVDSALDQLAQASPSVKRNVLLACAQTVAADGQVLYREAELLRAIADTLDCPIPPFVEALENQPSAQP